MSKQVEMKITLSAKVNRNVIKLQAYKAIKGEKIRKVELVQQLLEAYSEAEILKLPI